MPLRVLQVVTQMHRAGLETMLMNYYRHINRDNIQFDFLVHRTGTFAYDEEILSLGGKIYHVPPIALKEFPSYLKALHSFFSEHSAYPIVHCHLDALSGFALHAAKEAGIPVRIAHSHNNGFEKDFKLPFRLVAKKLIPKSATHYWGCSQEALQFLFGSKLSSGPNAKVIPNAIDPDSFRFNLNIRKKMRLELGIDDCFVLGNIGRLCYQKNQEFLLDIFHSVLQKRPKSALLLVGGGKDENHLRAYAQSLHIQDSVYFLGVRRDIPDLMQAMDFFVLPSRFEGLGIVLIEAQAAGLPCLASDKVSSEANLTGTVMFYPLSCSPEQWGEQILNFTPVDRCFPEKAFSQSGYDIRQAVQMLEQEYVSLYSDFS